MTNLCPRCGTQRLGDHPICQRCGLDFRMTGASAMPQQQLPPVQSLYGAPPPPQGFGPPAQQWPAYQQPTPYPQQFDYQQSAAPPPTGMQPDAAPTVCLHCYTPLQPGSLQCTNCGFDNRTAWSAPQPASAPKPTLLPMAIALLGVALLVAAAALLVVAQS